MNPNISLPQLPANLDPALRDYLFAWQKIITSKQLDDYSANKSVDTRLTKIESMYGIGAIYISINNVNPSTWMTGTTWVAFGTGKTIVGVDTAQSEFNTIEKTGGAKTHLLTSSESGVKPHAHNIGAGNGGSGSWVVVDSLYALQRWFTTQLCTGENASSAHNNLQPYITVYMWKRTA